MVYKKTGDVIYIGKGTGKRYTSKKNGLFQMVAEEHELDYRIVNENLSEYETLVLEEELIQI